MPAGQQDGDQQRHRQRVGQEGRQHEDQQLDDQVKWHTLGDDEVGQMIDAVDDEEKREERTAEAEGRDQFADDVAVENRHRWPLHPSVVP
jgi:hypothetical protein